MSVLEDIHNAFLALPRRAEKIDESLLEAAFVDTPPLLRRVSVPESQIVYGRRGTGKTHVLAYAAGQQKDKGIQSVYVDLRLIGSNQSIYNDPQLELTERATRLVVDVIDGLGRELSNIASQQIQDGANGALIAERLSDLSAVLTDVRVVGSTSIENTQNDEVHKTASFKTVISHNASATLSLGKEGRHTNSRKTAEKGEKRYHLSFGRAQQAVASLIDVLGIEQIQFYIDEWSEIPLDLQPLLADSLRKIFLTNRKIIIKIAAIEHRTSLIHHLAGNQYVGFEIGADIPTGLNLDDFLVFDNDQERAVDFFKKLLFNHLTAADGEVAVSNADELSRVVFTERRAVEEFVRAVEGVPRDALNLISILAEKRYGRSFGVPDVRAAAREWYTRDKAAGINSRPELADFLHRIISDVIRGRRARAFLVRSDVKDARIETLFDLRVLHNPKKNISSNEFPGVRFDVYKFDYGCYVDLISTSSAPTGLFQSDEDDWVEVPADDYRSIRRAVLDLSAFDQSSAPSLQ